jgi:hypothetical protein
MQSEVAAYQDAANTAAEQLPPADVEVLQTDTARAAKTAASLHWLAAGLQGKVNDAAQLSPAEVAELQGQIATLAGAIKQARELTAERVQMVQSAVGLDPASTAGDAKQQGASEAAAAQAAGDSGGEPVQLPPHLAVLAEAVAALQTVQSQLGDAAWAGGPDSRTWTAHELMAAAAEAAHSCTYSRAVLKAYASTVPAFLEGWQSGVLEALEQAGLYEQVAAQSLALAYHALTSTGK